MCEASSKNCSSTVLWGEIPKSYRCGAYVWKPITEYQNVIINYKSDSDDQIHCSDNNAFASDENEKNLCYDPVGSHIIQLRKFHRGLRDLLCRLDKESGKNKRKKPSNKAVLYRSIPEFPEFPEKYPFSESLEGPFEIERCSVIVRCKGMLSKNQVKNQRVHFVQKVFDQTGFFVEDSESDDLPFQYLSDVTDNFLQKFTCIMGRHKNSEPFCKRDDLWGPLETTLQGLGFGGIAGLHTFYYENIAKKHDILANQCLNMRNQCYVRTQNL